MSDHNGDEKGDEFSSSLEEKLAFQRVLNSFKSYRTHSSVRLQKSIRYYQSLNNQHRKMLKNYRHHLDELKVGIDQNFEFLKLIMEDVGHLFENTPTPLLQDCKQAEEVIPTNMDMDKVQSVLKQFMREWSSLGKAERDSCFKPILDELDALFPNPSEEISVLVPGAGLGRLAFEIAHRGFACQGNEFSFFMLISSCFVLNRCKETDLFTIYPFIHQYTNNLKNAHQLVSVKIPDVNPSDVQDNPCFSMTAGHFVDVYKTQKMSWDVIVTCFFIDTANNVCEYLETIYNCLKPGGYWINFGPLLYHFADMHDEDSIEPSYDDIKRMAQYLGFAFITEQTGQKACYCRNPNAMMKYEYDCVFFVARKPMEDLNPAGDAT